MSAHAQEPTTQTLNNATQVDLPEGWEYSKLGEIGEYLNGRAFKPSEWSKKGRPIIRIQDLTETKHNPNHFDRPVEERYIVQPGDLLISWSATLGVFIWRGLEAVLNQHIFKVRSRIDKDFHRWLVQFIINDLREETHGSGMVHITKEPFDNIQVPIPPIREQTRVAAKIEDLFKRASSSRERLFAVASVLTRFRQAVLAAACSGRLTENWRERQKEGEPGAGLVERITDQRAVAKIPDDEDPIDPPTIPEEWVWSRCGDLCVPERAITYGVIKLGSPCEGGVPTLRSSDVRWLHVEDTHIKRISPKIASEYSRTFLKGGEILVTVRGTLGGVALVPPQMAGFNISREVALIALRQELDANFFCYAIGSIWSQNWLSEVSKGVAYTGVNIRDLKRLPLPTPSLAEQHEIVRRVEALFKLADSIEKRVEAATKRAEKMSQAILAKAFRGELVPTEAELARCEGREYEPASVLLERIRAGRDNHGSEGLAAANSQQTKKSRRMKGRPAVSKVRA